MGTERRKQLPEGVRSTYTWFVRMNWSLSAIKAVGITFQEGTRFAKIQENLFDKYLLRTLCFLYTVQASGVIGEINMASILVTSKCMHPGPGRKCHKSVLIV